MTTTPRDTTIEAGAEKRFFIEMLTKDIELLPAIADLVDNSVDGARSLHTDGDLSSQWVRIKIGDESFLITDNSGGISVDNARHYAFRFGRSKDFVGVKRSVGQFGVGMKRAIFKIGQAFELHSTHRTVEGSLEGSRFSLKVDVEEWAIRPEWTFEFDELEEQINLAPDEVVGTTIEVSKLHPSVQDDLNDPTVLQMLKTELRLRHQESIQSGLKLLVNSETALTAIRPSLQSSALISPIYKRFAIETDIGSVEVRLYAGTIAPLNRDKDTDPEDEGRAENFQDPGDAGWYFFCNDRLLLVADRTLTTGWGNPAAAYHPQYRLFRGFVYLTADDASLLPWNTTKTAVDRDSPVFRAVQSEMKMALVGVQAVINRVKQVRSRVEDDDPKPEILVALDNTPDQPIDSLTESSFMKVPEAPPPKRREVPTSRTQRIQYEVDPDRFKVVARALGASSGSDVGRKTFDYFYRQEID